jgi:GntR family transcriptional regulator
MIKQQSNAIKTDKRPLYDQVVDAINRLIEHENYQPGDKLPREAVMAESLGISHTTLREAMGYLESQGVIERRHGVGTFVISPARGGIQDGLENLESLYSLVQNAGVDAMRADWLVERVPAQTQIAKKLGSDNIESLVRVQMTAREKDVYFAYFDSYIPVNYVNTSELEIFEKGSLLDYLIERDNPKLAYTNTFIYSISANENTAGWLRIPVGSPLLLMEEIFFSEANKPVLWSRNHIITSVLNLHIIRRIVHRL